MSSDDFDDLGQKIHQKILDGHENAPSQLFCSFAEAIIQHLQYRYPNIHDDHLIYDAVTEAMQNYLKRPTTYQPNREKSLLNYLKMSAEGDLKNKLDKESRRRNREKTIQQSLESEICHSGKSMLDTLADREQIESFEKILRQELSNLDWQLYQLIFQQEERATVNYVELLNLEEKTEFEQRKLVKQHKDRIKKKVARLLRKMEENHG
ncbi:MAG: hypothetical protein AB4041_17370 [Microcystaceae cyanobacterium]